eukprot:1390568-Amphidinium_carterae.1
MRQPQLYGALLLAVQARVQNHRAREKIARGWSNGVMARLVELLEAWRLPKGTGRSSNQSSQCEV